MVAGTPHCCTPWEIGATKTNEDARKTGIERRVIHWNNNVPSPAVNSATLGSSPVSNGINTMAPKATNSICAPMRIIFQFQNPPAWLMYSS